MTDSKKDLSRSDEDEKAPVSQKIKSPREKTVAGMRKLLFTGAALGMSMYQSGCDICREGCVVMDPPPPPIQCTNDLPAVVDSGFGHYLRSNAIWVKSVTGLMIQAEITISQYTGEYFSLNGEPTVINATMKKVTIDEEAKTITLQIKPDDNASEIIIDLPLNCDAIQFISPIKLQLTENPSVGEYITISYETS